jgi:hypothetical protein
MRERTRMTGSGFPGMRDHVRWLPFPDDLMELHSIVLWFVQTFPLVNTILLTRGSWRTIKVCQRGGELEIAGTCARYLHLVTDSSSIARVRINCAISSLESTIKSCSTRMYCCSFSNASLIWVIREGRYWPVLLDQTRRFENRRHSSPLALFGQL